MCHRVPLGWVFKLFKNYYHSASLIDNSNINVCTGKLYGYDKLSLVTFSMTMPMITLTVHDNAKLPRMPLNCL